MDKHVGIRHEPDTDAVEQRRASLTDIEKPFWQRIWPVIGCGAGLFSDGYLNGSYTDGEEAWNFLTAPVSSPEESSVQPMWCPSAAICRAYELEMVQNKC